MKLHHLTSTDPERSGPPEQIKEIIATIIQSPSFRPVRWIWLLFLALLAPMLPASVTEPAPRLPGDG
jgi:hypothetical protein